jgi:hypothetical protein
MDFTTGNSGVLSKSARFLHPNFSSVPQRILLDDYSCKYDMLALISASLKI